ncbi:MAG: carboxypeptidase regulatory-like domain-containing protein [Planctomycetes bacterium]|nr:carboxypeptidase regulatory-like domain-containing protein [Planctomycetota bacterium]
MRNRVTVPNRPSKCGAGRFHALSLCLLMLPLLLPAQASGFAVAGGMAGEPQLPDATADTPPASDSVLLVEGQVTDDMGVGQRGTRVVLRRAAEEGAEGEVLAETTTDELGDFALRRLEPVYGKMAVAFERPSYARAVETVELAEGEPAPFLAITLEGSLRVVGRVLSVPGDRPVRRAALTLEVSYRTWNAVSDDLGVFVLRGVPPGEGWLVAEALGFGRERQELGPVGALSVVVVRLKPQRVVRLRVRDDRGEPIAGATIEAYDRGRDDLRAVVTDDAGGATLHGLHFDATRLMLRLTQAQHVSGSDFDRELLLPVDTADSSHDLTMARAGAVAGRVMDGTGRPLGGARVMSGADYATSGSRAFTDHEGRFQLEGVASGTAVITVHLSGYAPELKTVEVRAGETAPLDVELSAPVVLTGVVRAAGGEPAPYVEVEAEGWRGYATLGLRAMTDAAGRFEMHNAPRDEFEIRAVTRGGVANTKVTPGNGAPVELVLSEAPALPPPGSVGLKVGDRVEPLALTTLDGQKLDLGELRGKTVLLDFWATWCAPCVAELPELLAVYEKFGGRKDLVMLGISLDFDEPTLRGFVARRKVAWPQVFGEAGGARAAVDRFGAHMIPAIFIIAPDGTVAAAWLRGPAVLERLAKLLPDQE